ncbi:hypothetical protein [Rubripirellula lacrimiformis]|nr:hypothetical protein [Rubripirellula lacrimiformis]
MRRLFRLVIGLALVVVVMKQASQEAVYRPFFGGASTVDQNPPPGYRIGGGNGQLEIPMNQAASKLDAVSADDAQALAGGGQPERGLPDDDLLASDLLAKDLAKVVDGSVWRGGDNDALYRLLDRATRYPDAYSIQAAYPRAAPTAPSDGDSQSGVSRVAVVPLLQQPDVFRGHRVAIAGKVSRAQRIESGPNDFGISGYWQVWLRPIDGADRPFVAIVPKVTSRIAAVGPDATLEDGPPAQLVGVFLKRLAYQSSVGADLAPVIVGRLHAEQDSEGSNRANGNGPQANDSDPSQQGLGGAVWAAIAAACVLGVLLAAFATWRSRLMTQHGRQLRAAGRPTNDSFLQQLSTNGDDKADGDHAEHGENG